MSAAVGDCPLLQATTVRHSSQSELSRVKEYAAHFFKFFVCISDAEQKACILLPCGKLSSAAMEKEINLYPGTDTK